MRSISDDVAIHNQGKNFLGGCRAVSGFAHSGLVYVVYQVRVAEPFVSAHRVCLCLVSATSGLAGAIVVVFVWIFSQKRSTTQTSLIQNPQLNFVLTGYGSALQIQHIILLFFQIFNLLGQLTSVRSVRFQPISSGSQLRGVRWTLRVLPAVSM